MHYHIIQPDGTVLFEAGAVDPETLLKDNYRDLLASLAEIVGGGGPEFVMVLYAGQVCTMVVDETGATNIHGGPKRPNARATAIYWTATIQGRTDVAYDPLRAPMIHGTAVLFEGQLP